MFWRENQGIMNNSLPMLCCLLGSFVSMLMLADAEIPADKYMQDPRMFQGDIELRGRNKVALNWAKKGYSNAAYAMIINKKWPYPKSIPYELDYTLAYDRAAQTSIKQAIAQIEKVSCLRFRKRYSNERAYLRFTDGTGCFSPVGYTPNQYNRIQLKAACRVKGVVIHEMLHSLGFWHEQNRPDRDTYVYINYSNIPQQWHYAFDKQQNVNSRGSPYDFDSIMHYGSKYFAIDTTKNTIITRDYRNQNRIGVRDKMSSSDIWQLNVKYCY